MAGEQKILSLVMSLDTKTLQNRMARVADRDLALALLYMQDRDRSFLCSCLPEVKAARVLDEIRVLERKRVVPQRHRDAVDRVMQVLAGRQGGEVNRGYFKRN